MRQEVKRETRIKKRGEGPKFRRVKVQIDACIEGQRSKVFP